MGDRDRDRDRGHTEWVAPLLPLPNAVLLPGAVTRVEILSPERIALVDTLLKRKQGEVVEIAVVPWITPELGAETLAQVEALAQVLPHTPQALPASRLIPGTAALSDSDAATQAAPLPSSEEAGLFHVGTLARVLQVVQQRGASPGYLLLLDGRDRLRVDEVLTGGAFLRARVTALGSPQPGRSQQPDPWLASPEAVALNATLRRGARDLLGIAGEGGASRRRQRRQDGGGGLQSSRPSAGTIQGRLSAILDAAPAPRLADMLVGGLEATLAERLAVLEAVDVPVRMHRAAAIVQRLQQREDVESRIAQRVETQMSKAQREHILRQQLRAIQEELGDAAGGAGLGPGEAPEEEDLQELERKLRAASPPPAVLRAAQRELRRMQRGGESQPGAGAARSYLECIAELPWKRTCEDALHESQGVAAAAAGGGGDGGGNDTAAERPPPPVLAALAEGELHPPMSLAEAEDALNRHHFGLEKPKQRIIEYLAVRRLRGPAARAPVLCFIGPPGVGKTSLARSVAAALGRPMHRVSLGGVRDEADIRGHRRTYIGAMPGRVIAGLRRVGVKDPVLLLDELDKTGKDSRGDPAAALLEVLDPEQNGGFTDHYVGHPFDLSKVVFFATANRAQDIPEALYDRLEVINIPGYTLEEKVRIATDHLVPRVLEEHGLGPEQLQIPPAVVEAIATGYTQEAGVRSLERALAALARHVAVQVAVLEDIRGPGLLEAPIASSRGGAGGAEWPGVEHGGTGASSAPPGAGVAAHWDAGVVVSMCGGREGEWLAQDPASPSRRAREARSVRGGNDGGKERRRTASAAIASASASASHSSGAALRFPVVVDLALLVKVLGPPKFDPLSEPADRITRPGVAAGLVWTAYGGQVQFVECCQVAAGRGGAAAEGGAGGALAAEEASGIGEVSLRLTGQLGEVLQESAQIALSWVRAHAAGLGLGGAAGGGGGAGKRELHIHFPSGAIPKDGPSAGVTLAVVIVSLLSGRRVRADTAMTGELTLSGAVLPVGGVKEKLLAAHRVGIRNAIIPAKNLADAEYELPAHVKGSLRVHACSTVEEVLEHALEGGVQLSHAARL